MRRGIRDKHNRRMRVITLLAAILLSACSSGESVGPPATARPSSSPSASASLAAGASASAGCAPATVPSDVPLAGRQLGVLHFTDKNYGWIVSGVGPDVRVLRTIDGGTSWSSSAPLTISYAIDLHFADRCSGWLLGVTDGGARVVLYGTTDGGMAWQEQVARPNQGRLTGATSGVGAVEVPDVAHAFVAADLAGCTAPCPSELVGTSDVGAHWQSLHAFSARVYAIRFANALNGWAVTYDPATSSSSALEATSDGGRTWTRRVLPPFADQIDFVNARDGWALGRDGAWCSSSSCSRWYLYRTTDGGLTWSRLQVSEDQTKPGWWLPNPQASSASFLSGPHFVDTTHGWIALSIGAGGAGVRVGGVITTADGGVTWQQSGIEPYPKSPNGVWFVDVLNGWATSGSLVKRGADELYRTTDGGRTWQLLGP
jgi:photosystem II stability/assembly factor-like uncharacterized protein